DVVTQVEGHAVPLVIPAPAAGTKNIATASAPSRSGLKLKRVTASKSAKNLFYIEYLKMNTMVTPATFEEIWGGLSKDEIKKWTALGKESRCALEPVPAE
ncbi:hypothetical protein HYPSUDRAFT_199941, partial [Hypholoma sublateritium FD-334 SS-4]